MLSDLILLVGQSDSEGLVALGGEILSLILFAARVCIGIGLVIFVHELGHFAAAKTFGVKCDKFYVGFDPPLKIGPVKLPSSLLKFQYGETEYGIGIIPLGGYVKMLGQDDDPRKQKEEVERARAAQAQEAEEDDSRLPSDPQPDSQHMTSEDFDPRSLPAKAVWQRMIIMSAGVFMNLVTGAMFAAAAFFFGVPYTPAIVGGVTAGGPAWQAGIRPGGEVVEIDGMADDQMHFREMRSAIIHAGLEEPDRAVPVTVSYDDAPREYDLITAPHPENEKYRMIGIVSPTSMTLSKEMLAMPLSVAADVLTDDDLGATIVAFDGTQVDLDSIVPGIPFLDYMYSHPDKAVELTLKRVDGSQHVVNLPPQTSRWCGFRANVGPINSLVTGGVAEKAGVKVGDIIESVSDLEDLNSETFLLRLAKRTPIEMTLRRQDGSGGESTVTVSITPDDTPQSLAPTTGHRGGAFNAYGFAFELPPTVSSFDEACLVDGDPLSPGDELQEIRLAPDNDLPAEYAKSPLREAVEMLVEGWEFDNSHTITALMQTVQVLPEGTKLVVLAKRPETGVIVESTVELKTDSMLRFERGMRLLPTEYVQTASSLGEASALGIRESGRRLGDVFRFLRLLVSFRVGADQVGGPIRIFQVAGSEAEQGISKQLLFLTFLSMNLAVLNFLPIPVLDGGHMVFLVCELVMGRRVNEEVEMRLTLIGGLMLLALMVFVVFNDLRQFF